MIRNKLYASLVVVAALSLAAPGAWAKPKNNAELVKAAMTALFINRDPSAIETYWGKRINHRSRVGILALRDWRRAKRRKGGVAARQPLPILVR